MPTDDRKRRILDHLSQSAKGANYVPKNTSPSPSASPAKPAAPVNPEPVSPPPAPKPTFTPPPQVSAQNRKRRIMDHLSLSSKEFGDITSTSEEEKRKRKIQEHIKKSQG